MSVIPGGPTRGIMALTGGQPVEHLSDEELTGLLKTQVDRIERNLMALRAQLHEPVKTRWENIVWIASFPAAGAVAWVLYLITTSVDSRIIIVAEVAAAILIGFAILALSRSRSDRSRQQLYSFYSDRARPLASSGRNLIHQIAELHTSPEAPSSGAELEF